MVKNPPIMGRYRRFRFYPWVQKIPCSRKWQPTLVFMPGKSHAQKKLVGYSPWGPKRVRHDSISKCDPKTGIIRITWKA